MDHPWTVYAKRLARERGPSHINNQIMGPAERLTAPRIVYVHPVPRARIIKSITDTPAAPNEYRIR